MKTKTKTLTVNQLHTMLGKLIEGGYGRLPVCVSKHTFTHPLERDGVTILNAYGLRVECLPMASDDGGGKYTKAGREVTQRTCVLFGYMDDEWQYQSYPNISREQRQPAIPIANH